MADKLIAVPESLLDEIGMAIGDKRDITTPIPVPDMPMQIGLIGGGEINLIKTIVAEHNAFTTGERGNSAHFIEDYLSDIEEDALWVVSNNHIELQTGHVAVCGYMVIINGTKKYVPFRRDLSNGNGSIANVATNYNYFYSEGAIINVIKL